METPEECPSPQKANGSKSNTSTPKRVSFGSHGEAVETQIIENDSAVTSMSAQDDSVLQETILRGAPDMDLNTNCNAAVSTPPSILHNASPTRSKPPIVVITTGAESHENPFQYDGELSKKADFIVRNSTISRTEVLIADPDKGEEDEPEPVIAEDQILVAQSAPVAQAAPDCVDGPTRPNDIKVKENGNIEEAATPQSVEIEVGKAEAAKPEVQEAEEVNIPKKRGKCCVLQ